MNIVFRCDASTELGTGHVYRCLTLADAFHFEGANIAFVILEHPNNLAELIREHGYNCFEIRSETLSPDQFGENKFAQYPQLADWQLTQDVLESNAFQPHLIIVDHYSLSHTWECQAKQLAAHVFVLDDLANRQHRCDLLLDQTLGRQEHDYREFIDANTKLLVGGNYCLLRTEFAEQRAKSVSNKEHKQTVSRLLISMGGADHDNASLLLLRALVKFNSLHITLLLGPLYEHDKSLDQFIIAHPELEVTIYKNVNNVAEVLAEQDIAIGASGASSWERMALGIPSLLYTLAPNQELIAQQLDNLRCAINMGDINTYSQEALQRTLAELIKDRAGYQTLVKNNLSAINASGAKLVVEKIKEHCGL